MIEGSIRITASEILAALRLPLIVAELRAAEPDINIGIFASSVSSDLLRRECAGVEQRVEVARLAES